MTKQQELHYMDLQFYKEIQSLMETARQSVYQTANFTMVKTYWQIGKMIVEKQGGEERAEYGKGLIKELSKQMTKDYGKSFSKRNLEMMRKFYLKFPNSQSLLAELGWTHYQMLLRVKMIKQESFILMKVFKETGVHVS